jgi:hypothetical protein
MDEQMWFAVVGTDGWRPVVWGIGATEDAAQADARENECGTCQTYEITAAQAAVVVSGDVSWPILVGE